MTEHGLLPASCRGLRKVLGCQVVRLSTRRGTSIVAAYYSPSKAAKQTLLFSHGNAVDLGLMLPFYRRVRSPACAAGITPGGCACCC
jgi:hypothetical protein